MDAKEMVNIAPVTQLVDEIGVKNVFGEPLEQNGVVIIPVAQVEYGFGYGSGYGRDERDDAEADAADAEPTESPGEGGGGGAGAGGRATPRGYIRIADDDVTYEPIMDNERVPLAGILMVAWLAFWVMLTIRTLIKAVAKAKHA